MDPRAEVRGAEQVGQEDEVRVPSASDPRCSEQAVARHNAVEPALLVALGDAARPEAIARRTRCSRGSPTPRARGEAHDLDPVERPGAGG